jgi:hypothetical protein
MFVTIRGRAMNIRKESFGKELDRIGSEDEQRAVIIYKESFFFFFFGYI